MVGGRLMIENNPLAVADDLSIDLSFGSGHQQQNQEKLFVSVLVLLIL